MDVSDLIRIGQISSVDKEKCRARVAFDDLDGLVSYDLPVLQHRTVYVKNYSMPEIGEHVLCIFLPSGEQDGFIVGSYFTDDSNLPPKYAVEDAKNLYYTKYQDNTSVEYDLEESKLTLQVVGDVKVSVVKPDKDWIEKEPMEYREGNIIIETAVDKKDNPIAEGDITIQTSGEEVIGNITFETAGKKSGGNFTLRTKGEEAQGDIVIETLGKLSEGNITIKTGGEEARGNIIIEAGTSGGTITLKSNGALTIEAQSIAIKGDMSLTGNLSVLGEINASGSIIDGGTNTAHHTH